MSCTQTLNGIARDCEQSVGGIKAIHLANRAQVSSVTDTQGKISAITMASSAKFVSFYAQRGTASMTSTLAGSAEAGTSFVETDLVAFFKRMSTDKRVAISALQEAELVALVEDWNGAFWYLGYDEAVLLTSGTTGETGAGMGDRNGYNLILHDVSRNLPYEVTASAAEAVID